MKLFAYLIACTLLVGSASSTLAQQAKAKNKAPKTATEVIVSNMRQANLIELQISDTEGKAIGVIKAPLAPNKKTIIKLAKGSPCSLTVMAVFDDEAENAGGQIDACKDKNIRFTD